MPPFPAGADLSYEGPANQHRGRADQYSKVLFQWQARRQPIRLADLVAASAAGEMEAGSDGSKDLDMGPSVAAATAGAAEMQLDSI